MSKYRILIDYGTEGLKFWDDAKTYESVNEAVKDAMQVSYSSPFLIVKVINWEAIPTEAPDAA